MNESYESENAQTIPGPRSEDVLTTRLDEIRIQNSGAKRDYGTVGDAEALLMLALARTLGVRPFERSFFRNECTSLAPFDSGRFISRLWRSGLIVDDPSLGKKGAYFMKGNEVWHYYDKVAYRLVPDEILGGTEDALVTYCAARVFKEGTALRDLWLEYAMCDSLAYLADQTNLHNIRIEADHWQEIESTIASALQVHSVAEIWSVIWKCVKDVAALTQREYYNIRKAAATLPGKLMRYFEKINKGEASVKCWTRHENQPAGTIGQFFYELFDIDENTPGKQVLARFASSDTLSPPPPEPDPSPDHIRLAITTFFSLAIEHDLAPEVLLDFAKGMRERKGDFWMALDSVFLAHPQLASILKDALDSSHRAIQENDGENGLSCRP